MDIINSNDINLVQQCKEKREDLIYKKYKEGSFNTDDFYLVRTTDYIYPGHLQYPLCNLPFLTKNNNIIRGAIESILDEKEHIDMFKEEDKYEERRKLIKEYLPLSTQYRSTIHFTLNGLVTSHSKGNFDNRNFIIIDKFFKHLGKSDIRSFKDADTFMFGDVVLSDEAVILVQKDKYEQLLIEYPSLKEYKVVLYEGNPKTAVEMFLVNNGIISFEIGQHGFEYSSDYIYERYMPNFMSQYLKKLKENFKIESKSHYGSQEYIDDDQNSLILWEYYDGLFFEYFFSKINIPKEEINILVEKFVLKENIYELQSALKNIISKIGLEKFKNIVDEFNANILQSIKNNTFEVNSSLIQKLNNNDYNK